MPDPHPEPVDRRLFSPLTVGTMRLRNRVMMPPHASAIGNIYGTEEEARRNIAYFERRCGGDGPSWVGSLSTWVRNSLIPGFEPTGVGAATLGFFRLPYFVERVQAFCDSMHSRATSVTVQMVHQGGMPHGASNVMSAPTINLMPHVMNEDDIAAFVAEYAESARLAMLGRADGVELHLNHDDIHEWFLSPFTNRREDAYGGSLEARARFAVECMTAIREVVGTSMTVGVRLNLREELPEGYGVDEGAQIAQYLESTGLIDYVHGVVGSPWGNPSYIQPTYFEPGQFAPLAGHLKAALSLPVVHTGRINHPDVAERILQEGHADVVGVARAHIAEPDFLKLARGPEQISIRPCVGGNECISRRYVEGLPFGCAVNPSTGHEDAEPAPQVVDGTRLLVVGGGPAGMELAALAREGGFDVELWEAADELGGQLRYVVRAPRHEGYAHYLTWQTERLARLGVGVRLGRRATADAVCEAGVDCVAIATGATPRRPDIDGVDAEHVLDGRAVMMGTASPGRRVLVVAQDDHVAPLSIADRLSEDGHEVTVVYATATAAPLLGRYIIGGIMGRLDDKDVRFHFMDEVVGIRAGSVAVRNVYSWRVRELSGFDSVVLACGSTSDSTLFDELRGTLRNVHVLGDAYAPRRMIFATRQAYALAESLRGQFGGSPTAAGQAGGQG